MNPVELAIGIALFVALVAALRFMRRGIRVGVDLGVRELSRKVVFKQWYDDAERMMAEPIVIRTTAAIPQVMAALDTYVTSVDQPSRINILLYRVARSEDRAVYAYGSAMMPREFDAEVRCVATPGGTEVSFKVLSWVERDGIHPHAAVVKSLLAQVERAAAVASGAPDTGHEYVHGDLPSAELDGSGGLGTRKVMRIAALVAFIFGLAFIKQAIRQGSGASLPIMLLLFAVAGGLVWASNRVKLQRSDHVDPASAARAPSVPAAPAAAPAAPAPQPAAAQAPAAAAVYPPVAQPLSPLPPIIPPTAASPWATPGAPVAPTPSYPQPYVQPYPQSYPAAVTAPPARDAAETKAILTAAGLVAAVFLVIFAGFSVWRSRTPVSTASAGGASVPLVGEQPSSGELTPEEAVPGQLPVGTPSQGGGAASGGSGWGTTDDFLMRATEDGADAQDYVYFDAAECARTGQLAFQIDGGDFPPSFKLEPERSWTCYINGDIVSVADLLQAATVSPDRSGLITYSRDGIAEIRLATERGVLDDGI